MQDIVWGFVYEGLREKEEGAWELPGFLVTEEGELVPGTGLGNVARGRGLRARSQTGPWTCRV